MAARFRSSAPPPMLSAILWDNDGVLVDTERFYYQANRDYLRGHGIELSEAQFFEWFLADNCGAWHLLEAGGASAEQIARWRRERARPRSRSPACRRGKRRCAARPWCR